MLDDIEHHLKGGDATSKRLLAKLADIERDDEESVQNWLAEQLMLRARERFHVHRETEVADHDRPDIIASAASGLFEVGIEVKQADSWSPAQLSSALIGQLTEGYLRVQTRRHGILFLTDHRRRIWKRPGKGGAMTFGELLDWLSTKADALRENSTGPVTLSVFGVAVVH